MNTKVILIVSIILFFAAGLALGMLMSSQHNPPPPPPRHGEGRLEKELNLTPVQREQMRKIWFIALAATDRQDDDQRTAVVQERDQKIQALLSQEQLAKYEELQQNFDRKMDELANARRQAVDQAVDEQVKKILTPEQVIKYDELMKDLRLHGPASRPGGRPGEGGLGDVGPGGPGGPGGFRGGPRYHYPTSASRPTTRD
jgi:Spy/CpxP family protein refolding chaperone